MYVCAIPDLPLRHGSFHSNKEYRGRYEKRKGAIYFARDAPQAKCRWIHTGRVMLRQALGPWRHTVRGIEALGQLSKMQFEYI
jgi:hypothetical protein